MGNCVQTKRRSLNKYHGKREQRLFTNGSSRARSVQQREEPSKLSSLPKKKFPPIKVQDQSIESPEVRKKSRKLESPTQRGYKKSLNNSLDVQAFSVEHFKLKEPMTQSQTGKIPKNLMHSHSSIKKIVENQEELLESERKVDRRKKSMVTAKPPITNSENEQQKHQQKSSSLYRPKPQSPKSLKVVNSASSMYYHSSQIQPMSYDRNLAPTAQLLRDLSRGQFSRDISNRQEQLSRNIRDIQINIHLDPTCWATNKENSEVPKENIEEQSTGIKINRFGVNDSAEKNTQHFNHTKSKSGSVQFQIQNSSNTSHSIIRKLDEDDDRIPRKTPSFNIEPYFRKTSKV